MSCRAVSSSFTPWAMDSVLLFFASLPERRCVIPAHKEPPRPRQGEGMVKALGVVPRSLLFFVSRNEVIRTDDREPHERRRSRLGEPRADGVGRRFALALAGRHDDPATGFPAALDRHGGDAVAPFVGQEVKRKAHRGDVPVSWSWAIRSDLRLWIVACRGAFHLPSHRSSPGNRVLPPPRPFAVGVTLEPTVTPV